MAIRRFVLVARRLTSWQIRRIRGLRPSASAADSRFRAAILASATRGSGSRRLGGSAGTTTLRAVTDPFHGIAALGVEIAGQRERRTGMGKPEERWQPACAFLPLP